MPGLESLSPEILCAVWQYSGTQPSPNLTRLDRPGVTVFETKGLLGRLCPVSPAINELLYSSLETLVADFHGQNNRGRSTEGTATAARHLMRSATRCDSLSTLQVGNLSMEDSHLELLGDRMRQLQHLGCFNAALRSPNLSSCTRLRTLNLRQCGVLVAVDLSNCGSLTSLDLSFTPIGDKDLRTMLPLPFRGQIRHLLLKHCKNVSFGTLPGERQTSEASLLVGWAALEVLNVGHTHTTAETLLALARPENSPSLERIEATGQTRHAKDLRLGYRSSAVFQSVELMSEGALRHLVLTRCERLSCLRLHGAMFLQSLELSKTSLDATRVLASLVRGYGAPHLRRLVMQEAKEINVQSEVELSPAIAGDPATTRVDGGETGPEQFRLAQLQTLDLRDSPCRSSVLAEVVAAAPRLRELGIKNCVFTEDGEGVPWPAAGGGRALEELVAFASPRLEELDASSNSMALHTAALSGTFAACMLMACPRLAKFNMSGNYSFTGDLPTDEFAGDMEASNLLELHLSNSGVEASHLQALVHRCPKLRRLTAKSCVGLVASLDLRHGVLQEVSLAHCVNLPGLVLDLPLLRVLDLTECSRLTANECSMEPRRGIRPPRLVLSAVDVDPAARQVFVTEVGRGGQ